MDSVDQTAVEDRDAQATGTALALPAPTALADMFRKPRGVLSLVERIEAEARSHAPDLTTVRGREAVRSLAFKVAKSKVALDEAGKALTEEARAHIDAVNEERRLVRTRLDALKDEVRKPLDDWEAAEVARVKAHQDRLAIFAVQAVPETVDGMHALITTIEETLVDESWEEFKAEAQQAKALCLNRLDAVLAQMQERDRIAAENARQAAELAQLRAEKAAREEADRLAREAAEAEARRIEAERAEAERARLAAERAAEQAARIEAEKQEAARLAAERAEERAKAEAARLAKEADDRAAAAEARHQREMAEAAMRERAAARAERDRIEAKMAANAAAAAKRAADQAHRKAIRDDIATSMNGFTDEVTAGLIADAIMGGKIPHVEARL